MKKTVNEKENKEVFEEEKKIYFRVRYSDGHEVSNIISEKQFNKRFSDYDVIEDNGICRILKAKE